MLYEIESEVRNLDPDLRRQIRQEKAAPVMDLHSWMLAQRNLVLEGSAISKAMDYSQNAGQRCRATLMMGL